MLLQWYLLTLKGDEFSVVPAGQSLCLSLCDSILAVSSLHKISLELTIVNAQSSLGIAATSPLALIHPLDFKWSLLVWPLALHHLWWPRLRLL